MRNILAAVVLLSVGTVTAAAEEYYLVRDPLAKQCSIIKSPPNTTELTLIGNGHVYFERSEAERALAAACTPSAVETASPEGKAPFLRVDGRQPAPAKKPKTRAAKKVPRGERAQTEHVRSQIPTSPLFSLFR